MCFESIRLAPSPATKPCPHTLSALGKAIVVVAPFYNHVLIPTGLLLLATTAAAPLLTWGKPPSTENA